MFSNGLAYANLVGILLLCSDAAARMASIQIALLQHIREQGGAYRACTYALSRDWIQAATDNVPASADTAAYTLAC